VSKIATICAAFVVVLMLAVAGGAIAVVQSVFGASGAGTNCAPVGATATSAAGFGPQQMSNAATIVAVGNRLNVPEPGWVIAIATAITESRLQNLDYGDRDSVGLFQQRPSQGWGTAAQIMDPVYSSEQFYRHLLAVQNWQNMTITDAAQAVQRSGFPDRYGTHEQSARQIVGAVKGATCAPRGTGDCNAIQAPSPAALAAIKFACSQRGLPYLWGGDGPELTELPNGQSQVRGGFDCSGLTKAAYAAAGIQIPRTAQTQYNAGPGVPAGQPVLPGDLVFFGSGPRAVTHVGIAISAEEMVDAPDQGLVVRVERIWRSNFVGATRPAAVQPSR
jgi:cell wall-associated NlpC family hydrolase